MYVFISIGLRPNNFSRSQLQSKFIYYLVFLTKVKIVYFFLILLNVS